MKPTERRHPSALAGTGAALGQGYHETRDLRLITLRLRNFKGVGDFTLAPQGADAVVYGDNATGKTTLFDGFLWLLFGKDSAGQQDFSLKPLGPSGEPLHNLQTEVEGVFSLGDRTITLRKVYAEKWTRKRGSTVDEFTGHTTDHYVDGVPVQKKEYDDRIREIADEDAFRLLTSPSYFAEQLHWRERRKILLDVCGDLSDEEVIAGAPSLADLPSILQGRALDDHRKVLAARRKEINDELQRIPVRIDEAQRSLPDVSGVSEEALEREAQEARAQLMAAREALQMAAAGGALAEARVRIASVDADLSKISAAHETQTRGITLDLDYAVQDAARRVDAARRAAESARSDLANSEARAKDWAEKADAWRQQFRAVSAREYVEGEIKTACPSCGQNLPEDRIEDARRRARETFVAQRSEELERITARGKDDAQQVQKWQEDAARCREVLAAAEATLVDAETALAQAKESRAAVIVPDISSREDYREAQALRQAAQDEITRLQEDSSEARTRAEADVRAKEEALRQIDAQRARLDQRRTGEARIADLTAQESALAVEFERLERELYLTEEFVRQKVRALEERINGRFRVARFRLFEPQINGGLQEACEVMCGGVPYLGGLNNAARINVGLDIIQALAEHYGFTAPVFVDNAEAVVRLGRAPGQIISLVVSGQDAALRVEPITEKEAV